MISFEWRGIDGWIRGAGRFGGAYGQTLQPEFDRITGRLYEMTQQRVHVISGELKASGTVVPTIAQRSSLGIESLDGGVVYTSEHGFWEMNRGGEHDFITEPLNEVVPEYLGAMDLSFKATLSGW